MYLFIYRFLCLYISFTLLFISSFDYLFSYVFVDLLISIHLTIYQFTYLYVLCILLFIYLLVYPFKHVFIDSSISIQLSLHFSIHTFLVLAFPQWANLFRQYPAGDRLATWMFYVSIPFSLALKSSTGSTCFLDIL